MGKSKNEQSNVLLQNNSNLGSENISLSENDQSDILNDMLGEGNPPLIIEATPVAEEPQFNSPIIEEKKQTVEQQLSQKVVSDVNQNKDQVLKFTDTTTVFPEAEVIKGRPVVILHPITSSKFRLGLEQTTERYNAMPGTAWRYSPKKVGNQYRTGLDSEKFAPTAKERAEKLKHLEYELGRKIDNAFYDDMTVKLDPNKTGGEKLYLDQAEDLLIYLTMLDSDQIAIGLHQKRNGLKPFAEWYIEDREGEVEEDAKMITRQRKAIKFYDDMSDDKRRAIATVVGIKTLGVSSKVVNVDLYKWLTKEINDTGKQTVNADLFIEMVLKGDAYINVYAIAKHGIDTNIIRMNSNREYVFQDMPLGGTVESAVLKLGLPVNSHIRLLLEQAVVKKINAR